MLGCSGGRGERRELWPSTFVVVSAERKGQGRKAGLRLAIFSVWFGTKLLSLLVWYLAPGREVDKGVARRSCSRTTQWPLGRTSKLDQAKIRDGCSRSCTHIPNYGLGTSLDLILRRHRRHYSELMDFN